MSLFNKRPDRVGIGQTLEGFAARWGSGGDCTEALIHTACEGAGFERRLIPDDATRPACRPRVIPFARQGMIH